ncbi:MAG: glucokinase [Bacteroidetes bacterium RIFOXYA12_FULL_35_11]|nr:MAG: glucokinase [Bacteroidetes bacterium GWF2_35_48]OFY73199.1 MAG: glucokinase [Bacteroidetes bacterium RIFOXYA12_FULL_35_11]OFY93190.1 MAG: glucokinase [Bacteroidetes bacterium RIFOXYB2_FULL_35_7]HBX50428.1 glucokinase [Bacteroidales bacterium]
MNNEVTVGIDIGGTNSVAGVVDRTGKCLAKGSIDTRQYPEIEGFIEALASLVKKLISEAGVKYKVKGIGIGAPNGNCKRGSIENAPNLKWKGIIPLKELMQKYFNDIPILITNDANAAALGEQVYGNAKDLSDFIVITLGTGLGSGFITAGKLMCGHDGFAGELGHTIAVVDGRPCGCGRRGCLETYASATGITKTVIELLEIRNTESVLRNVLTEGIDAKKIHEAACLNDPIALEAFEFTGKLLGRKLADTVAITNPQAIFLFGGLANAGEYIFKPTRESMKKNMMNIFKDTCRLLPSGVDENNAAILGASALPWKAIIKDNLYLCPGHHI